MNVKVECSRVCRVMRVLQLNEPLLCSRESRTNPILLANVFNETVRDGETVMGSAVMDQPSQSNQLMKTTTDAQNITDTVCILVFEPLWQS